MALLYDDDDDVGFCWENLTYEYGNMTPCL